MSDKAIEILRHILTARIDNADSGENHEAYLIYCTVRDIVEYALADNIEILRQFDYLPTKDED